MIKFRKEPRKVVLARFDNLMATYQKDKIKGMSEYVEALCETINNSYFVDNKYGTVKTARKPGSPYLSYQIFPGANKPDKKGRKKFKKGAVVSRSGRMQDEFRPPIRFTKEKERAIGHSSSSNGDVKFYVTKNRFEIDIKGRTDMLMRIHINKSRTRIIEYSLKRMKKVFADKIKAQFDKSMDKKA